MVPSHICWTEGVTVLNEFRTWELSVREKNCCRTVLTSENTLYVKSCSEALRIEIWKTNRFQILLKLISLYFFQWSEPERKGKISWPLLQTQHRIATCFMMEPIEIVAGLPPMALCCPLHVFNSWKWSVYHEDVGGNAKGCGWLNARALMVVDGRLLWCLPTQYIPWSRSEGESTLQILYF